MISSRSRINTSSRKDSETSKTSMQERLAKDLAAFRKAGGRIERLGDTRTFNNIVPSASSKRG